MRKRFLDSMASHVSALNKLFLKDQSLTNHVIAILFQSLRDDCQGFSAPSGAPQAIRNDRLRTSSPTYDWSSLRNHSGKNVCRPTSPLACGRIAFLVVESPGRTKIIPTGSHLIRRELRNFPGANERGSQLRTILVGELQLVIRILDNAPEFFIKLGNVLRTVTTGGAALNP